MATRVVDRAALAAASPAPGAAPTAAAMAGSTSASRRRRPARSTAVPNALPNTNHAANANPRILAIANPPGECPWCMSEMGLPGTVGTTTRMCRWHEFTTWIQLATRYPALWPKVRAEFGQAVLVRLVAPATALADGATGAGALVVDIAVR